MYSKIDRLRICLLVAGMIVCVRPSGVSAQDLTVDFSSIKLLTLNNLSSVAGMVLSMDSASVSVRKSDGIVVDIPRASIMKIDVVYWFLDDVPDGNVSSTDTSVSTLTLIGDIVVTGRPVLRDSSSLTFRLQEGRYIRIPLKSILSIVREDQDSVDEMADKKNDHFDSYDLFLAPTGRPQGMGNVSLNWSEIFLVNGSLGVFDFLTLSGGTNLIGSMYNGSIKLSVPGPEWLHLSGGVSAVGGDEGSCYLPFIAASVGSRDFALTTDLIYGIGHNTVPALVIGGESRIGRRTRFIIEYWQLLGSGSESMWAFSVIGIRTVVSREIMFDIGLMLMNKSMDMDGSWGRASTFMPWGTLRVNFL